MRAASVLRAPVTFQQATVNSDLTVDTNVALATTMSLRHVEAEPRCVRLNFHANVLDEANGYLTYIVERYDTLPAKVLFFKGSFEDFDRADTLLEEILKKVNTSQYVAYASLPTEVKTGMCERHVRVFQRWVSQITQRTFKVLAPSDRLMCFQRSQFIASRQALQKWPRMIYEHIRAAGLMSSGCPSSWYCGSGTRHGGLESRQWLQFYLEIGGFEAMFRNMSDGSYGICKLLNANDCAGILSEFTHVAPRTKWQEILAVF